jgi:AraC-like DNA-binding protein
VPWEPVRSAMLSSTTGVFREPHDFQVAMREYGCTGMVVTGRGTSRARLTRIALHRLRLLTAEESLARIASFSIPDNAILVSVPLGDNHLPAWDGTAARSGEIVTLGASHRLHSRSTSHCRWGAILLPTRLLLSYARTINGDALALPSGVCTWRPTTNAFRNLIRLHISATRVANARVGVITTSEPARTLEYELIDAVIACLSGMPAKSDNETMTRHANIMARFEDLLQAHPSGVLTSAEICLVLDISARTLRAYCDKRLGMGPNLYMRLHRMQLVRRALRCGDGATISVAQIAAQHGFTQAGRFAGAYRAQFGEFPSVTLRRSAGQ